MFALTAMPHLSRRPGPRGPARTHPGTPGLRNRSGRGRPARDRAARCRVSPLQPIGSSPGGERLTNRAVPGERRLCMRTVTMTLPGPLSETDVPDGVLVSRVAAGDGSALEALYDRYSGPAFGLARQLTGEPGCAGEVVRDVF